MMRNVRVGFTEIFEGSYWCHLLLWSVGFGHRVRTWNGCFITMTSKSLFLPCPFYSSSCSGFNKAVILECVCIHWALMVVGISNSSHVSYRLIPWQSWSLPQSYGYLRAEFHLKLVVCSKTHHVCQGNIIANTNLPSGFEDDVHDYHIWYTADRTFGFVAHLQIRVQYACYKSRLSLSHQQRTVSIIFFNELSNRASNRGGFNHTRRDHAVVQLTPNLFLWFQNLPLYQCSLCTGLDS